MILLVANIKLIQSKILIISNQYYETINWIINREIIIELMKAKENIRIIIDN